MTLRSAFLAVALAAAAAGGAAASDSTTSAATTTVILVRHAEKNPHPPGGDAGLSARGLVRAQELARALADAKVAAVYVSPFGRARLTGEPLARALGDSVRTYDANRSDLLASRLVKEHPGGTVLVVGHGDSVPEVIDALGGGRLETGEGVEYDRMFVLTLGPGDTRRLVRLRYGAKPEG